MTVLYHKAAGQGNPVTPGLMLYAFYPARSGGFPPDCLYATFENWSASACCSRGIRINLVFLPSSSLRISGTTFFEVSDFICQVHQHPYHRTSNDVRLTASLPHPSFTQAGVPDVDAVDGRVQVIVGEEVYLMR